MTQDDTKDDYAVDIGVTWVVEKIDVGWRLQSSEERAKKPMKFAT